jgi:GT2 family glycosyltransferase
MNVQLITVAAGRHDHLRRQLDGLRRSNRSADGHVVVAIDDPQIASVCGTAARVVPCARDNGRLPLARARNLGAADALRHGADLLVFLDVDCIPGTQLIDCYVRAAHQLSAPALLSGPVSYLPPPPPGGYDLADLAAATDPHPARPMPSPGAAADLDYELFWSLSFAVPARAWRRIGGFCEQYAGYGAEDTDFAMRAKSAGVRSLAVGGADAYHQWHPTGDPPLQHLDDILRNGRIFRDRWGWWPMSGWLAGFRDLGLVRHDPDTDDWQRAG